MITANIHPTSQATVSSASYGTKDLGHPWGTVTLTSYGKGTLTFFILPDNVSVFRELIQALTAQIEHAETPTDAP